MAVQATSLKLASVIAIDAAGVGEGPDVRRIVDGFMATSSGASGSDFLLFSGSSFISSFTSMASGRPTPLGNVPCLTCYYWTFSVGLPDTMPCFLTTRSPYRAQVLGKPPEF